MQEKDTKKKIDINCLLGLKDDNAQIFDETGATVPVTLVKAGPCKITQIKTKKKDGYNALQVSFKKNSKKSKKSSCLREFRIDNPAAFKVGQELKVDQVFKVGDKVHVTGTSKAKGFQGAVKRHKFSGAPATHGTKHAHRQTGSIGATEPARVFKGRRMPGRMGGKTITVRNLAVATVDGENNILAIKGALPGNRKNLLKITKAC